MHFRRRARRRASSSPRAASIAPARRARGRADGVAVITVPETRWARVDIKSVSLLPNVLAKQAAREQGAREAWFVDEDGFVTEGASSNAWIVTARRQGGDAAGRSRHPARHYPHRAARRHQAHDLGSKSGHLRWQEAYAAREAFVTAASQIVLPVSRIDGRHDRQWRARPDRNALCGAISTATPNFPDIDQVMADWRRCRVVLAAWTCAASRVPSNGMVL